MALAPDIEAALAPASLDHPQVRARIARRLARLPRGPQVRVSKLILKRIGQITLEERELRAELKALIEAHCPALLDEHGCGPITAAIIIAHTAGAKRFPTDSCFARHAGIAPTPPTPATPNATVYTAAATDNSTARSTSSRSPAPAPTPPPRPTSPANTPKAKAKPKRSAASNATSPANLAPALRHPTPSTTDPTAAATVQNTHQHHHRHRPRRHAMRKPNPQIAISP